MSKHSAQFKRAVVEDYLSGKYGGSGAVAHRHGVDHGTVRIWVAAWRAHGEAALQKKYSRYDGQFKLKVLQFMTRRHCRVERRLQSSISAIRA
jgi:transposase